MLVFKHPITDMFLTLSPKKIIEVNNIINKSSIVKPKIRMTTKRPLRKQIIIPISQDNSSIIGSNTNFHINIINRHLKDANSNNSANFIHVDKVSIIITTSITASEQDMRTIKKAIKNSKKINKDSVKSLHLPQSKSYLKILGLPYFIKNINDLITSQVFEEVLKESHIFKDIEFFLRPLLILIQLLFGLISGTLKQVQKQRALSTDGSMLVTSLPLFIVLGSA